MSNNANIERLVVRSWTHSHEEDHDDRQMFRPSERDFPPARGRESFTLQRGGVLVRVGPGPDDRPVTSSGTWSLAGDRLDLYPHGASPFHYVIEAVEPDRLVVTAVEGGPERKEDSDAGE